MEEELSSDEEETNQDVDELDEDMETSRKGSHRRSKRPNDYDEDADVEDHVDTDNNGDRSSHKKKQGLNSSYKEDNQPSDHISPGGMQNKKFQFKMSSNKQASTVYGSKFMDFRKTFHNFNANSNKALGSQE